MLRRVLYAALFAGVGAVLVALVASPQTRVIGVIAGIMLVVGSAAALIWWRLADSLFPGASRKTGQSISLGRGGRERGRRATGEVIRGFDDQAG